MKKILKNGGAIFGFFKDGGHHSDGGLNYLHIPAAFVIFFFGVGICDSLFFINEPRSSKLSSRFVHQFIFKSNV